MAVSDLSRTAEGCQQGLELVSRIKRGEALPDELHVLLQSVRATGEGDKLRALTRQIQKALEDCS